MNNYIGGVDYSMTSPAVCVHPVSIPFAAKNCKFLIQYNKKEYIDLLPSFDIKTVYNLIPKKFDTPEHRWDMLSDNVVEFVKPYNLVMIGIEQYSFGSFSNNNFQMGENTGLLKYKLYKLGIQREAVNITHVKIFSGAEGGGNASKGQMLAKFKQDEPLACKALDKQFGIKITRKKKGNKVTEYVDSPVADIIDAYYITKYIHSIINGGAKLEVKKKVKNAKHKKT